MEGGIERKGGRERGKRENRLFRRLTGKRNCDSRTNTEQAADKLNPLSFKESH